MEAKATLSNKGYNLLHMSPVKLLPAVPFHYGKVKKGDDPSVLRRILYAWLCLD
jgi:hypothetical protein